MDAATWKVLADSYERSAISLRGQADEFGHETPFGASLLSASYTAGTLRAAALDVVDYLKKAERYDQP